MKSRCRFRAILLTLVMHLVRPADLGRGEEMDEVAGELREPQAARHAQQGMHSAAGGGGATIGGQDAAQLENLIERVCCLRGAVTLQPCEPN